MIAFDENFYLEQKLQHLQRTDPYGIKNNNTPWTNTSEVRSHLSDYNMTPEQHFLRFGYKEDLSPNIKFNTLEYLYSKTQQLNEIYNGGWTIQKTYNEFHKYGLTPWTHYVKYGSKEGLSPSFSLDAGEYCKAKADLLNANGITDGQGNYWTASSVASAIYHSKYTILDHYLKFAGTGNNEVSKTNYEKEYNFFDYSHKDYFERSYDVDSHIFKSDLLVQDSSYNVFNYTGNYNKKIDNNDYKNSFTKIEGDFIVDDTNSRGSYDYSYISGYESDDILLVSGKAAHKILMGTGNNYVELGTLENSFSSGVKYSSTGGDTTLVVNNNCINSYININGDNAKVLINGGVYSIKTDSKVYTDDTYLSFNLQDSLLLEVNNIVQSDIYANCKNIDISLLNGLDGNIISYGENIHINIKGGVTGDSMELSGNKIYLNIHDKISNTINVHSNTLSNILVNKYGMDIELVNNSPDNLYVEHGSFNPINNKSTIGNFSVNDRLLYENSHVIDDCVRDNFTINNGVVSSKELTNLESFVDEFSNSGRIVAFTNNDESWLYYSSKDGNSSSLVELDAVKIIGLHEKIFDNGLVEISCEIE